MLHVGDVLEKAGKQYPVNFGAKGGAFIMTSRNSQLPITASNIGEYIVHKSSALRSRDGCVTSPPYYPASYGRSQTRGCSDKHSYLPSSQVWQATSDMRLVPVTESPASCAVACVPASASASAAARSDVRHQFRAETINEATAFVASAIMKDDSKKVNDIAQYIQADYERKTRELHIDHKMSGADKVKKEQCHAVERDARLCVLQRLQARLKGDDSDPTPKPAPTIQSLYEKIDKVLTTLDKRGGGGAGASVKSELTADFFGSL